MSALQSAMPQSAGARRAQLTNSNEPLPERLRLQGQWQAGGHLRGFTQRAYCTSSLALLCYTTVGPAATWLRPPSSRAASPLCSALHLHAGRTRLWQQYRYICRFTSCSVAASVLSSRL